MILISLQYASIICLFWFKSLFHFAKFKNFGILINVNSRFSVSDLAFKLIRNISQTSIDLYYGKCGWTGYVIAFKIGRLSIQSPLDTQLDLRT